MDERRKNLTENAIEDAIRKTMENLHAERDTQTEQALEKFIEKINIEPTCPIGITFKDENEREKFQEAIPSLLEFNEGVKKTRKATKWVGLVFFTYFINEFIGFGLKAWEAFQSLVAK